MGLPLLAVRLAMRDRAAVPMLLLAGAVFLTASSEAIGVSTGPGASASSPRRIARVDLDVAGLAWVRPNAIVTTGRDERTPGEPLKPSHLRLLDPETGASTPLMMAGALPCERVDYMSLDAMADDRVAAYQVCGDPSQTIIHRAQQVVAVDPVNGTEELVADFSTVGMTRNYLPVSLSYDPSSKVGIGSVYGGVCGGLVWLTGGGAHPVDDVFVGEGEQRFALGAPVIARSGSECEATGQVAWPDISSVGMRAAFVASPESVGVPIAARWDQPFGLYMMDLGTRDPVLLLEGIRHPRGVQWSPDGKSLLVSGTFDVDGQGTWVVDTEDGSRRRVAAAALGGITWSPEGTEFAGIDTPLPQDGSAPTESHIWVVPIDDPAAKDPLSWDLAPDS
jgi:hypothetical protein